MSQTEQLSRRLIGCSQAQLIAIVRFLMVGETWAVAARLNLTKDQANENVSSRVLDFLADAETKIP